MQQPIEMHAAHRIANKLGVELTRAGTAEFVVAARVNAPNGATVVGGVKKGHSVVVERELVWEIVAVARKVGRQQADIEAAVTVEGF